MNGKRAKKIRKSVYGGLPPGVDYRDRGYTEIESGQIIADGRRRRFQMAKKTQK